MTIGIMTASQGDGSDRSPNQISHEGLVKVIGEH